MTSDDLEIFCDVFAKVIGEDHGRVVGHFGIEELVE